MRIQAFFTLCFVAFLSATSFAQWTQSGSILSTTNKVGIRVTSPVAPLDVNGGIHVSGTTLLYNGSPGGDAFRLGYTNNFDGVSGRDYLLIEKTDANDYNPDGGIAFVNTGKDGKQEVSMKVLGTGNIVIGNATSDANLNVAGGTRLNSWLRVGNNTDGYSWTAGISGNMIQRKGHTALAVEANDKVTIGGTKAATGFKLSVDGKIMAEELRVQLSGAWPDYVFHNNYERRSLYQLEQEIQTLGHLPGVPSAAAVEANGGADVGEMQRILLEKVEELTLYVIDLKKENDQLKQEVENLKSK